VSGCWTEAATDTLTSEFVRACSLDELKVKGWLVVHGRHAPILLLYDHGRVFALDNRCPHMGFPLERGSVADGILTCHWHHARFDLASGCTFDLWADDVPTCLVDVCEPGEVWVRPVFGHADPAGHWRRRLQEGLAHNLDLVIAKAVRGQLAAGVPAPENHPAGRALRAPEPGWLGQRPDHPHGLWQPAAGAAGGGNLPCPVPWRPPGRSGL
jgi:nitrite reductase/ring-hydroxylating ferredoxin subunit